MFSSQFDGSSQSTQSIDSGLSSAKSREAHGIIPVTVKRISESSHSGDDKSNFVIDGVDATNVSLVGIVYNKAERVTDVSFNVDDGTGRIECNRWFNESFDTKQMENIHDGMYVRVNGHAKSLKGKIQIVVFSVRPVTNFDEIAFHFIECIHFHVQNSRIQKGDTLVRPETRNPSLDAPTPKGLNGSQTSLSNQFSGQFSVDGLKGLDQMVLAYLQQPSNFGLEKGVHRDELAQKLKIHVEKIMESIRVLEEEGLIYSTIDEFHYKSTVGG